MNAKELKICQQCWRLRQVDLDLHQCRGTVNCYCPCLPRPGTTRMILDADGWRHA